MKTILVEISEQDYKKFVDKTERVDFKTLRKRVLADTFKRSINGAVREAKKGGLSSMTLAEINAEISAVRNQHD